MSNVPGVLNGLADLFGTYAAEAASLRDTAPEGLERTALASREDTWHLAAREARKVAGVAAERGW